MPPISGPTSASSDRSPPPPGISPSLLDSTLSAFSQAVVRDLGGRHVDEQWGTVPIPSLADWIQSFEPLRFGRGVMVVIIALGSAPLWTGADILQTTTISGTMVLGLAPVFVRSFIRSAGGAALHLAFWPGVVLGMVHAAGWRPE